MSFKKITLSIVIIALAFGSIQKTNAQAALVALIFGDKVATEHFNISMEVGMNFSQISNLETSEKYKSALNFGIAGNLMLSDNWFVSPAIFFVSKRALKLDGYYLSTGNTSLDNEFMDKKAELSLSYIDIPIFFSYQTNNKKLRFGVAPQVSFLKSSSVEVFGDDGSFIDDIKAETNSFDYGVLGCVGYSLGEARKGKGLYVQLRYYQGLGDVFKNSFSDSSSSQVNRGNYFSLHVSLPFITDKLAEKNLHH